MGLCVIWLLQAIHNQVKTGCQAIIHGDIRHLISVHPNMRGNKSEKIPILLLSLETFNLAETYAHS